LLSYLHQDVDYQPACPVTPSLRISGVASRHKKTGLLRQIKLAERFDFVSRAFLISGDRAQIICIIFGRPLDFVK
jgi:hypothetical protein